MFNFFIRRYRITYLIIAAILILGLFSVFTMPKEADPEVKIPFAVVTAIYPGANPTDIEELVTNKLEEKIKNLENLQRYSSTSGQGFSSVFVEFNAEADLADSYQKLRDSVANIDLPSEVEDPHVTEIRMSDMPIATYNLTDHIDPKIIQTELESIQGVSKVEIVGNKEREFQVIINQLKLANFNISLGQIIGAIQSTNINMPAGSIKIEDYKYNVRVRGKIANANDLENIIIATYANSPIYLKDIAQIQDTFAEQKSKSRIGFFQKQSQETISLQVYKKTGGNIINIVDQADKLAAKHSNIEKTSDNAWFIRDTLKTLGISGLQTMVLIIILLFLILGIRGALITGFSVPLAFLMAFISLKAGGNTLNSMVLYSLIISLGLMVDNSIIIMEGINEYMVYHHEKPLQAAISSVRNFKWPIISGTLTTVAAFLPMLLVSGILGEYFAFIPKTITATLLSSLFVALIIIPTLSARFIKTHNNHENQHKKKISKRYHFCSDCLNKLKAKYGILMQNILQSKKRRRWVLASAWIVFILVLVMPILGFMKVEMFPFSDFDTFWVGIEMTPGTTLERTSQKAFEVEKIISQIPETKNYVTNIGSLISLNSMSGSKNGSHLATITVNLKPSKERKSKSFQIVEKLKPKLESIQGAKVSLEEASAGPPSGAPIEVRIFGPDLVKLAKISETVKNILINISGTQNIKDSLEESTPEFVFSVNRQMANYYGLSTADIAFALRTALHGSKVSQVNLFGDDIDIIVKYKDNLENLDDILVAPNITLGQVTQKSLEPSLLSILHRDGEKIVTVSSNISEKADLRKILKEFDKQKQNINLPAEFRIDVGGEVEDIEQSYRETFMSMIVAVILIAFILVLQFNSFRQPFIILLSLPLAVIGVILGFLILQMPFSFPAFLGIVSLAGIAVNDAIVLIDRVNKNIKSGLKKIPALVEAGQMRMQPIFLTSITTIAGVFPLIFANEIWRPFSLALIFGLIFSTVLTLVIVPVMFNALVRVKK